MASELWKLLLGCAAVVAGFSSYFLPITLADREVLAIPFPSQDASVPLEGTGSLRARLQFNATLPDRAQDSRYALVLAASVRIERVSGEATVLNVTGNGTIESVQARVLEVQLTNASEPSETMMGKTPTLPLRCPCPRARAVFQFDLSTSQNDSAPHAYRFTLLNSSLELHPADWDDDGVPDTSQWVAAVPQYYWGFPLTIIGGVILARRFTS